MLRVCSAIAVLLLACDPAPDNHQQLREYWRNQFSVSIDTGPHKDDVHLWLAKLDSQYQRLDEQRWQATFGAEPNQMDNAQQCVTATIVFDDQDNVSDYLIDGPIFCFD